MPIAQNRSHGDGNRRANDGGNAKYEQTMVCDKLANSHVTVFRLVLLLREVGFPFRGTMPLCVIYTDKKGESDKKEAASFRILLLGSWKKAL